MQKTLFVAALIVMIAGCTNTVYRTPVAPVSHHTTTTYTSKPGMTPAVKRSTTTTYTEPQTVTTTAY
ncbi:MAG: hypothetical protein H0W64_10360 [Gammaproteobacteria bacterium]|nr:hypothetical protein [Gammaproteobacteria bacterium]